jgi:F0F1-type ATP synthase assembly protein I
MKSQLPKKKPNKWLALINIPIQMGVVIFLFSYLGNWLDEKYPNPNTLFVKALTLIGVALAFYNINRQLKEINEADE